MLTSWKFWAVMLGIVALTGLFAFGFTKDPKLVPSPLVNRPAPAFSITEMNTGQALSSSDLKGKPYILNFWASWCVPCRQEAAHLEAAYQKYERQQGVLRVIGIAIQDAPEAARDFAKRYGKTYFLAVDNKAGDIALNYGLYGVPETFLVDAEGIIRFKNVGATTTEVIERDMLPLIRKK
ncbi:MAG: redoxin domain-containing protein [Deltaproteobacteria bacterium]|nr:redoxin domain-containing protein [Deltaproteobacteria bacterium]